MFNTSQMPLVTIGVASYNNAGYLADTLDSTIQENYANREVIIVDDCSTDESVQVAREWIARHPDLAVKLIANEVNKGVCRVLNQIVNASRGVFISTIGSDDVFLPNKLATQVPLLLSSSSEVGMLFSDISKMDSSGKITVPSIFATNQIFPSEGDVWIPMLKTNFIPAMTILIRKSCFESVGLFDESLAYEDWDMWLRLARKFKFIYQPEITALYRIHGGSAMHKRKIQIMETNLRIVSKQLGVSEEGDTIIYQHIAAFSEELYLLGSSESVHWLQQRHRLRPDARGRTLLFFARLGIPVQRVAQAYGWVKRLRGKTALPSNR